MRTLTTWLAFTALATITGCRSSVHDKTRAMDDETSARRGIGEACRKNSDCIAGAICSLLTCDFMGPCAVTATDDDRTTHRSYVYDDAGREVSITTTHDDERGPARSRRWAAVTESTVASASSSLTW